MFVPTRSSTGNHYRLRAAGHFALLLSSTTGVVVAAIPSCRIALQGEAWRAQTAVVRRVHHSAATLARWKIGAEAWSKAHHGKVYAGRPSAPIIASRTPLSCSSSEIATESSAELPLLQTEALPEFNAGTFMAAFSKKTSEQDILFAANSAEPDVDLMTGITYAPPVAGLSQGEVSNGSPVSSPFALPSSRSRKLLAPHHGSQEMSLYPEPLPPTPVPTPEPSEWILLSTALVALAVGAKFGMVKLERPANT